MAADNIALRVGNTYYLVLQRGGERFTVATTPDQPCPESVTLWITRANQTTKQEAPSEIVLQNMKRVVVQQQPGTMTRFSGSCENLSIDVQEGLSGNTTAIVVESSTIRNVLVTSSTSEPVTVTLLNNVSATQKNAILELGGFCRQPSDKHLIMDVHSKFVVSGVYTNGVILLRTHLSQLTVIEGNWDIRSNHGHHSNEFKAVCVLDATGATVKPGTGVVVCRDVTQY